jgi:hypothetical protein
VNSRRPVNSTVRRIENLVNLLRNMEGDMVSGRWHNDNGKGMRTNANDPNDSRLALLLLGQ